MASLSLPRKASLVLAGALTAMFVLQACGQKKSLYLPQESRTVVQETQETEQADSTEAKQD